MADGLVHFCTSIIAAISVRTAIRNTLLSSNP